LSPECRIAVSQFAHGTRGFSEWLLSFHGMSIRHPQHSNYLPRGDFTKWHRREVFRGPARETLIIGT
jgi:putative restriction endonuclease